MPIIGAAAATATPDNGMVRVFLFHDLSAAVLVFFLLHLLFLQMLSDLSVAKPYLSSWLGWFGHNNLNATQRGMVLQRERRRSGSNM